MTALGVLWLVALLQFKHAICDGPLQTLWMLKEKGIYGKAGGLAHAGIHGAGSLIMLLVFGMGLLPSLLLAAADALIHYHVDYAKESVVRKKDWSPDKPYFWWALTVDQMLHHFTYLGMAAVIVVLAL